MPTTPAMTIDRPKDQANAVRAEALSKRFTLGSETVDALIDVNLTVPKAEFLAVMGPSGSGKSTLLHILGLLEQPDSGEVTLDGQATGHLNDDALTQIRRERLGFIFQNFELIPNLNAKENILLPAEVAGRKKEAERTLTGLAAQLGLESRLKHRPNQLSGGQQQRVAIARALINEPVVILADEPTGNLDTNTGNEVLDLLRRGVREEGWTVIMVTHDPKAALFAERIIFLRDGRIVGETRTDEAEARARIENFVGV